jgi:hypothetical protein
VKSKPYKVLRVVGARPAINCDSDEIDARKTLSQLIEVLVILLLHKIRHKRATFWAVSEMKEAL